MRRTILLFMLGLLVSCTHEIPTASLVIEGVSVIDVSDGSVTENTTLVLDGDRIRAVGRAGSFRVPDGTLVVDGTGKYAIPGLWDIHVHALWPFWYDSFLKLFVAHGITGFRETWGALELAEQLREQRASGERLVPRFVVAGNLVDGADPIWPGSVVAATPEAGRNVVDSLIAAGAEFIKVYSLLAPETFQAIADQAKRAGIPFAGHVPASVRAADAAEAGQTTIEHLTGVAEGCASAEGELISGFMAWRAARAAGDSSVSRLERRRGERQLILSTQEDESCDELMEVFFSNQTRQVPTLVTLRGYTFMNDAEFTNDPRLKYLPPSVTDFWDPEQNDFVTERTEDDWRMDREMLALYFELTGRAKGAGVPILAGSDTPNPYAFPGSGLHDELELLVEAGLTPLEALQAATLNVAAFLEATESLGTIDAGKLADIVLLGGNPLEDIGNVRKIHAVVLNGKLLTRDDLDALLMEVEALAAEAGPFEND